MEIRKVATIKQASYGEPWVEFRGTGYPAAWRLCQEVLEMARRSGYEIIDTRKREDQ